MWRLTLEPTLAQNELTGVTAGQRQGATRMMSHRDDISA
jgi:hypothetical protein